MSTVADFMPFPGVGGTEVAALRGVRATQRHGYTHVMFSFQPTPEIRSFFHHAGVPMVAWPAPPQPSLIRSLPTFLRQSVRLARELRRLRITLVHCQDVLAAQQGALAAQLARIPVLCHVRNRHDRLTRRDCVFLWPCDHFVFVSQSSWQSFGYHVDAGRGTVVYDGVTPLAAAPDTTSYKRTLYESLRIPNTAVLVGTTARIAPAQKDLPTLIRALSLVAQRHPNVILLIVGDYSSHTAYRQHYQELRALANALGIGEQCRFAGHRDDVPALLHTLDVFALSSRFEGFPLATLEAMAAGRPVVASAVDGICEQITHGVDGFLTPPGDPVTMAAYICELIESPALAKQISAAARKTVGQRFSESAFERGLVEVYQRWARGAAAPRD